MEYVDYKLFKKINNITNLNIAEFLGVSEAYVSMVTSGKTKFSEERFAMLLDHPTWDTDALLRGVHYQTPTEKLPQPPPAKTQPQPDTEQRLMAELEKATATNLTLTQNIAELIAQQGELIKLIKKSNEPL